MPSLSGSLAYTDWLEYENPQLTGMPIDVQAAYPSFIEPISSSRDRFFKAEESEFFRDGSTPEYITYHEWATILWRTFFKQLVQSKVEQDDGLEQIVDNVIDNLTSSIQEIKKVQFKIDVSEKFAKLFAFVDMPEYNRELMDRLIEAEVDADLNAMKHGYRLIFRFIPLQFGETMDDIIGLDSIMEND